MEIAIAIDYFDPDRGGAEQWTYQFVKSLLRKGHHVHVVAQAFSEDTLKLPLVPHVLGRIRSRMHRAAAAEACLRSLPVDIIHDMGMGWYCDVFESHDGSRLAQWQQKCKTLPGWMRPAKRLTFRFLPRYLEFRSLMARQFGNAECRFLALSEQLAHDYQALHGVHPERIRVIHNGVDTDRFSPSNRRRFRQPTRRQLGVSSQQLLVLFVGHDFQRKGLATLLRATGLLLNRGHHVRLAVAGGRRVGRFERIAVRHGIRHAVEFLGPVRDPVPYYAAADVFVLPTYYDPCSLSVLEAAACGLPSVTTQINGAADLITDGMQGYVMADPADHLDLAQKLAALVDEPTRVSMGDAARRLALEHTLERQSDSILGLYKEILRMGPSGIEHRRAAS
jgi:UDP-glucose:(heptosyl)LPS alpha-1,3-glucosyltransferase